MAASWRLPGLRYFVVTSRADTRPVFLAPGQNSILYVKQMSNFHWEDRVFFAHLNKIDWNKSCYRKNSTERVSGPGKREGLAVGCAFRRWRKRGCKPSPPRLSRARCKAPTADRLRRRAQRAFCGVPDACVPVRCAGGVAILTIQWLDGDRCHARTPKPCAPRVKLVGRTLCSIAL